MSLADDIRYIDGKAKHWTVRVSRSGESKRYECTVWAFGRRFTVSHKSYEVAVSRARQHMDGLVQEKPKGLKLVG